MSANRVGYVGESAKQVIQEWRRETKIPFLSKDKTEDELRTHIEIEHTQTGPAAKGAFKANSLLGFAKEKGAEDSDEERGEQSGRGGRGRGRGGK